MNVLIFDHLSRVISLQASPQWLRDVIYQPDFFSKNKKTVQRHIEKMLDSHRNLDHSERQSQKYASLLDQASLAALPASQMTGIHDQTLAIIDFPGKTALFRFRSISGNLSLQLDEASLSQINPHIPAERARLVQIKELIQKKIIHVDGYTMLKNKNILKAFNELINHKLSTQKPPNSNDIPPALHSALTYLANCSQAYFSLSKDTTKWSVSDYYVFSPPKSFVIEALDLLVSRNFVFTPEQEAAWHSPDLPHEIFEPLHHIRTSKEKEMLNAQIVSSANKTHKTSKTHKI